MVTLAENKIILAVQVANQTFQYKPHRIYNHEWAKSNK